MVFRCCLISLVLPVATFAFAKLTPQTTQRFDAYVQSVEQAIEARRDPGQFLIVDAKPELKTRLRDGEMLTEQVPDQEYPAPAGRPDGLHHWRGMMFIRGASLGQIRTILQDYDHYQTFYQPHVIESKEISHHGDEYDIFLRLYEKYVLTVVLNSSYRVRYITVDPRRMEVTSRSTRIAEARSANGPYTDELSAEDDHGFLWRLNSYWRFEEADGGVYAQCEAVSLSRDVPLGLGWMLKGFVEKFPRDSMKNTLQGTKAGVLNLIQNSKPSAR